MRKADYIKRLLMAAALAAAVFAPAAVLPACGGKSTPAVDVSIEQSILELEEGCQTQIGFTLPDGLAEWKSSDESVAVCENGTVTALAAGRAVITLTCGDSADSVNVSVTGDVCGEAEKEILSVVSNGADIPYLRELSERLGRCGSDRAAKLAALTGALLGYADGAGNRDALYSAAAESGIDEAVCLDAAEVCFAAGKGAQHAAVFSFTGDCTLAACNEDFKQPYFPAVYKAQDSLTYPFDRVKALFHNDTLTVINFEGTLTERSAYVRKSFYFRGLPEYADILPASGIEAANLANNHAADYLGDGYSDTLQYLTEAGVTVFDEKHVSEYTASTPDGDIRVVLLSFSMIDNTRYFPDEGIKALMSEYRSRPDTLVVVSVHAGIEYQEAPEESQLSFCRAMIDEGADIVIGHHPHIIQGIEYYNGGYIAYSLGNFSFGGNPAATNPETFILQAGADFADGEAKITDIWMIPCSMTSTGTSVNNYQPCFRHGEAADKCAALLLRRSEPLEYGVKDLGRSGI